MATKQYLRLRHHEGSDAYYLELRDHPHELVYGIAKRTVNLHAAIAGYDGPGLHLDLDEHNRPIGIEILYRTSDDDGDA
jgi:hypothetical protein